MKKELPRLHVLLPEAEDCERVDEWKREQRAARKQRMGCKRQRHAIHTVTSDTLVKNHNPNKGAWLETWQHKNTRKPHVSCRRSTSASILDAS
ncbi:hypothetical protein JOB18_036208 [Solea senegalensis]|uniref:Uncharacterized protein n=1 Tax=Solea senegalensis TaxID=28829 RepID=A0AAV6SUL9_SOLSE|nr:hypothetical protein JOB18_036208 [Solea senegalensis]